MSAPALTFDEEAAVQRVLDCGALDVPDFHPSRQMYFRLAGWGFFTIEEVPGFWRVRIAENAPIERKQADEALIRELLAKDGPETVAMELRQRGYAPVSRNALKRMRKEMVQEGTAEKLGAGGSSGGRILLSIEEDGLRGSTALEEAINSLYQREANRLGCSVTAAMYKMNFSRAQLEKMVA